MQSGTVAKVCCCVLWLCGTSFARAQSTSPASQGTSAHPVPSASPDLPVCAVGAAAIVPRDTTGDAAHGSRTYAAYLWSPLGPGVSTGTLWVNTSAGAYHISFTQAPVWPKDLRGDGGAVSFRLPEAAPIEDAFVDHLEGGEGDPARGCTIFAPWTPGVNGRLPAGRLALLERGAIPPPSDAQPIADPAGICRSPDLAAQTVIAVVPNNPDASFTEYPTIVDVAVWLAADSSLEKATVISRAHPGFDGAALGAVRKWAFQTKIVGCRPVASTNAVRVEFDRTRRSSLGT